MSARRSLLALTLVAIPATALADVLVVQQGGPVGTFATIQSAVDAAVDGDVVVVKSGLYAGFTVDGKALTIAAAPLQSANTLSESRVVNLPLGKRVLLAGLTLEGSTVAHQTLGRGLTVQDCLGAVRVQSCSLVGASNLVHPSNCQGLLGDAGWPGLWVESSYDVVVTHSNVSGGNGMELPNELGCSKWTSGGGGAPAVRTVGSRLAMFHTFAMGGAGGLGGWGGSGGHGLHVVANSVFLYAFHGNGGSGGFGIDWFFGPGGSGGHGIHFTTPGFSVAVGTSGSGGSGGGSGLFSPGADGQAISGAPANTFDGPVRDLTLPSTQLQSTSMTISFTGAPQELPVLLLAASDSWVSLAPLPALLLVAPAHVLVMPPVPASGKLDVTVPAPALPPGVDAIVVPMQSAFLAPTGNLAVGPARHLVVLAQTP